MIIQFYEEKHLRKYKKKLQRVYVIQCDNHKCNKIFIKETTINCTLIFKQEYHFCNNECQNNAQRKEGILDKKKTKTYLKNLGVKHPAQCEDIVAKRKKTCIEKYGTTNPLGAQVIRDKCRVTLIKKFGVEHIMHANEIVKKFQDTYKNKTREDLDKIEHKRINTNLKNRGVKYVFQDPTIKEKSKQTRYKKNNGNYYSINNINKIKQAWSEKTQNERDKIHKKFIKTVREKFGVDYPSQSDIVKEKIDYKDIRRKQHKTMKDDGCYNSQSKEEKEFYKILCNFFNKDDIEINALINNNLWPIDFYIKSINIYVQYDGIYWHGLDRSIEEIKKYKTARDKIIYRKYCTDKKQEKWFKDNNLTLIRVRSDEFYDALKNDIVKELLIEKGVIK